MNYYHLSPSSFSEKLQIQRSSLSHFFTGRNKPGWDFLEKLARTFPQINLQWFLTGSGNMFHDKESTSLNLGAQPHDYIKELYEGKGEKNVSTSLQQEETVIDKIIILYKNGTCKIYQPV
ncbi:MAG: helix-turn-helix transcriptional regulator [Flavobacteriales bacterium]|nr:helix-turn-helix transcriptional regulator [Flavobacteriales bacterium]